MTRVDQVLVDRVIEWRTMCVGLAEIVRPRIDMGIEMHQPDGTSLALRQRAQQRQRYAMLAAQGNQVADAAGLQIVSLPELA